MADGCNLYFTEKDIDQVEKSIDNSKCSIESIVDDRIKEAYLTIPHSRDRIDFGRDFGIDSHQYFQTKLTEEYISKGYNQVKDNWKSGDFATEFSYNNKDGENKRWDFVDFKNDIIIDWKPKSKNDTDLKVALKHYQQLDKYRKDYKDLTGRNLKTLEIRTYPSTKDLFK